MASWNGVQIAEVARLSPPREVPTTAAAATLFLFVGYVEGPAGFALLTQITGSFFAPLGPVAAVAAASALVPRGTTGPQPY